MPKRSAWAFHVESGSHIAFVCIAGRYHVSRDSTAIEAWEKAEKKEKKKKKEEKMEKKR